MNSRERRLPPGQHAVARPRRVDIGSQPVFDPATWQFTVCGLVENALRLSWPEFTELPIARVQADLHCVEGWSVLDLVWEGPRLRQLLDAALPSPQASFVYVSCADGYSTSLPLEVAMREDVILARLRNGQPIPHDEGGPIQLIVPDLYAYKWARWVRSVEVLAQERLGYWESRGYSNSANVWREERRA
jgi:DMSO/TMAO reductase YedYZ molybdopterin-dependent catalytic subunit